MKNTDFGDFNELKNLVGGTIRFYLSKSFNLLTRRKNPIEKSSYTKPPSLEEDYLGHKNVNHKNRMAFILVLFFILSITFKICKSLL